MAFSSGFFDNGAGIGELELGRLLKHLVRNGINAATDGSMGFAVSINAGKAVIAPGFCMIEGAWGYNDAAMTHTLATPTTYPVIYRAVLRRDIAGKSITAAIKAGTPASSPVAPALQQDGTYWELPLAQIRKTPAGDTSIAKDERPGTDCGAYGSANDRGFSAYMLSIQTLWDAWFAGQQGLGFHHLYVGSTLPTTLQPGDEWDEVTGSAS